MRLLALASELGQPYTESLYRLTVLNQSDPTLKDRKQAHQVRMGLIRNVKTEHMKMIGLFCD